MLTLDPSKRACQGTLRHHVLGTPPKPALGLRVARGGHHHRKVLGRGCLQPQARHLQHVAAATALSRHSRVAGAAQATPARSRHPR